MLRFRPFLAVAALATTMPVFAASLPHYDHIVVVIEENHAFREILGVDSPAPYMRFLASEGATLTQFYAIAHPSQPNYLALFSGSTQGVTDDSVPPGPPFTTPNLGAELRAKGLTFAGYSQSLPATGFNDKSFSSVAGEHHYERKHNPWTNWQSAAPGPNQLPESVNRPFESEFPTHPDADFSSLPTIAFVIPDEQFDMHDGSIAAADEWLRANLSAYATWARDHNSLLIVTFDEDDGSEANRIATFFYGAHLRAGRHSGKTDHYGLLRTLEDLCGLDHAGAAATAAPIAGIFAEP